MLLFSTKGIKFFKDISLTSKAKYPLTILSTYVSLTSNAIQVLKFFQKQTKNTWQIYLRSLLGVNKKHVVIFEYLFKLKLSIFNTPPFSFNHLMHVVPLPSFLQVIRGTPYELCTTFLTVPCMDLGFTQSGSKNQFNLFQKKSTNSDLWVLNTHESWGKRAQFSDVNLATFPRISESLTL